MLVFFLWWILGWMPCGAHQTKPAVDVFRTDCIYLVCRGTQQKSGLIAEKFNRSDRNSTHVGIGLYENRQLMVYHVANISDKKSDLVIESLTDFQNPADLFYLSIWQSSSNTREVQRLKQLLQQFIRQKIVFDTDFELDNNKLYCSEFCALVLQQLNPKKYRFLPQEKNLNGFLAQVLHRKVLTYYPVDFFQKNRHFKKTTEVFYP